MRTTCPALLLSLKAKTFSPSAGEPSVRAAYGKSVDGAREGISVVRALPCGASSRTRLSKANPETLSMLTTLAPQVVVPVLADHLTESTSSLARPSAEVIIEPAADTLTP